MNLTEVSRGRKHKRSRRVGRGPGAGRGKTASRGNKGQGQLAGWTTHPAFEGGQMPLSRRIPKRGFNNQWAYEIHSVNVGQLEELFKAGEEVTVESLRAKNLVHGRFDQLKILGDGELKKKLKVSAHKFSASAKEKIEKAGGEVIVVPGPAPVKKNKQRTK